MMGGLTKEQVKDARLWTMIDRVQRMTSGEYRSCDDHASTLVPLMDRILLRAKEQKEWSVYFYAIAQFLWLVQRTAINDIHRRFQLSELFHRDSVKYQNEEINAFGREWQANTAAKILQLYLDYPQIDDAKMEQMLELFQDYVQRYGRRWNYADYNVVMWMALTNQDRQLAETARKTLAKTDFWYSCYACYYGKPMIGYYVLHEDIEGIEEIISRICTRRLPEKHQWFYARCENCEEKELVNTALEFCLKYGSSRELFWRIFTKWKEVCREPETGELNNVYAVIFHALAGDWSRDEDRLRLAEKTDRGIRKKQESPLDTLYWSLCWHCYFRILDRNGIKTVQISLGGAEDEHTEGKYVEDKHAEDKHAEDKHAEGKEKTAKENLPEWSCLDVAEYFKRQADELGAQMDRARKRFDYARVQRMYEECLLNL